MPSPHTTTEPAPRTQHRWSGHVAVEHPRFETAARHLAEGTCRPLTRRSLSEAVDLALSEPVTWVGPVEAVTQADLAALPARAMLGLFLSADADAAAALARRCVDAGSATATGVDVCIDTQEARPEDPVQADGLVWLAGADLTPYEVRDAVGDGCDVLAVRAHARDCFLEFAGAGVCGRARTIPLRSPHDWPAGLDTPPTACQQANECCKAGHTVEGHVRAADLAATVCVMDACRTAMSAEAAAPHDASLPLAMLHGRSVAVAAALGPRTGAAGAAPLFTALLRDGAATGEALAEVNTSLEDQNGALGRLVLFGDAGLHLAAPGGGPRPLHLAEGEIQEVTPSNTAARVTGARPEALHPGGPLAVPTGDGAGWWVLTRPAGRDGGPVAGRTTDPATEVRERLLPWIARQRSLRWLGLRPDAKRLDVLEHRARAAMRRAGAATDVAASDAATEEVEAVAAELRELQARLGMSEVTLMQRSFYSFVDSWPEPWRVVGRGPVLPCPQCERPALQRWLVSPDAGTAAEVAYESCARCGEMGAGDPRSPVVSSVVVPSAVARGDAFEVELRVDVDRPCDIWAAVSFRNDPVLGVHVELSGEARVLPGSPLVLRGTAQTADTAVLGPSDVRALVFADGGLRCETRQVNVQTAAWRAARADR